MAAPASPHRVEVAISVVVIAHTLRVYALKAVDASDTVARFFRGRPDAHLSGLRPGWLPWSDRQIDLKDAQFHAFRDALPMLCLAAVLHCACTRAAARRSPRARLACSLLLSVAGLGFLHEGGALLALALAALSFAVSHAVAGARAAPLAVWSFHVAALVLVRRYDGLQSRGVFRALLGETGSFLDAARGEVPWAAVLNLSVLRMISFGLDLHRATLARAPLARAPGEPVAAPRAPTRRPPGGRGELPRVRSPAPHAPPPARAAEAAWADEDRALAELADAPHPVADYDALAFLASTLYLPLLLAGPVHTFNAWLWCIKLGPRGGEETRNLECGDETRPHGDETRPHRAVLRASLRAGRVAAYAFRRFALPLLVMEVCAHYVYAGAMMYQWQTIVDVILARSSRFSLDAGHHVACLFFGLKYVWLKLLVPWRFFRAWALADGVLCHENMRRCMSGLGDLEGFWRMWHASTTG
jgi:hypothetical protein